jgi:hypothetical protein
LREVLVVDRGSSDGTADITRRVGGLVRLIERPRASVAEAVAAGTAEAVGEIVAVVPDRARIGKGALDAGLDVDLRPVGTTAFGRAAAAIIGIDVPSITVARSPGSEPAHRPAQRSWYLVADSPMRLACECFGPRVAPRATARGMPVGVTVGAALFGRGWLRVALPLGHAGAAAARALRAGRDPGVAPHRAFLAAEIRDWAGGAAWWVARVKR